MAKNIGKNISKNISSKYSQKLLDHAKESVADVLKTASKRVIQKAATATSDLIVSKIADVVAKSYDGKTKKVSKNLPENNSETVTNEHDKEGKRQKIIDDLRLI